MTKTGSRPLRPLAGAALALLVAILAAPGPAAAQPQTLTVERVDRLLRTSPQASNMFNALRTHYPAEYRGMLQRFVATLRSGASLAATQQASFAEMRRFMASKMDAIASAPEGDLAALARDYGALAEALARADVRLCAQWSTTGFRPDSLPPPDILGRLDRISAAQIIAARRSEAGSRVARAPVAPTDMQAVFERMNAIDPGAAALIASGGIMSAPADRQCQAGRVLYRAVAELPPAQAAAVTVALLRQYFGSAPAPSPAR